MVRRKERGGQGKEDGRRWKGKGKRGHVRRREDVEGGVMVEGEGNRDGPLKGSSLSDSLSSNEVREELIRQPFVFRGRCFDNKASSYEALWALGPRACCQRKEQLHQPGSIKGRAWRTESQRKEKREKRKKKGQRVERELKREIWGTPIWGLRLGARLG